MSHALQPPRARRTFRLPGFRGIAQNRPRPRPARRWKAHRLTRALAVVLGIGLAPLVSPPGPAPNPTAYAAIDPPTIRLALDGGTLDIAASWSWAPDVRVRIFDPAGRETASVARWGAMPPRPPSTGQSSRFTVHSDATGGIPARLSPGDTIEIQYRDDVTRIVVPQFDVRFDAAADAISGSFPSASTVEFVVWNSSMYDEPHFGANSPHEEVAVVDGRARVDLAGRFDVRPGTAAQVTVDDADGNRFTANRAMPDIFIGVGNGVIYVRADPGSEPRIVARRGDANLWDSGPLSWSAPVRHEGTFTRSNDAIGLAYLPRPGDQLALWLGSTLAAETIVPALTGRHDPEIGAVTGLGPAGATLRLGRILGVTAPPDTTAGADGRFAFEPLPLPDRARSVGLSTVDRLPFTFDWSAEVTQETVTLFGNRLSFFDDGLGTTQVTYTPPDGGPALHQTSVTRPGNVHSVDLIARPDHPAFFDPGGRLDVVPEKGTAVSLTVPAVGVTIDAAANAGTGYGPPSSWVRVELGDTDIDRLAPAPRRVQENWLRTHTNAAGRFTFRCEFSVPCLSGVIEFAPDWRGPATGRPTYRWFVQDAPMAGIAPDISALIGVVTAGTPVTATLLDADGRPVDTRTATARVDGYERPMWVIDWRDRFPNGIPIGARFSVRDGGQAVDLRLPATTLGYDVLTDEVWGTTPPVRALDVWVLPQPSVNNPRSPQHIVQPPVDDAGRWRVSFHDRLNVRAGDSLLVNGLAPDGRTFYQLVRGPLDGPLVEPTETAEPPPTGSPTRVGTATPTPGPTATPRLPSGRVWLPLAYAGS